jgi:hypothetical protein
MRHEITGISASIAVKIPRIITGPSIIWQLISTGSVGKIQEAFSKGLTSIYDVDNDGESLLHVGRLIPNFLPWTNDESTRLGTTSQKCALSFCS